MENYKRNVLYKQINKIKNVSNWLTINFNLFDIIDGINSMEIAKEHFKKLVLK